MGEAINRAQEVGLDLIEIAPNVKPPVCKIMDSGKFKYELQKKASLARKKQKIISLKEIKLRPVTDVHDYDFKIKNALKFLTGGDKVKFTIKFKGREMEYMKAAYDLVRRITEDTKEILKQLEKKGIRTIIDLRNEKINYKIREHSLEKIPVLMICGTKEIQDKTITLRRLGKEEQQTAKLDEIISSLSQESQAPKI